MIQKSSKELYHEITTESFKIKLEKEHFVYELMQKMQERMQEEWYELFMFELEKKGKDTILDQRIQPMLKLMMDIVKDL